MAVVRLSGSIQGRNDPNREVRGRMLYWLFAKGWDIYNSNGDQRITLSNIEAKIVEADSFVFMPGASIEDLFKALSIFVGYQTMDRNLAGKATAILNSDGSWDPLFALLDDLRRHGTIKQDYRRFLLEVFHEEGVLAALERVSKEGLPDVGREKISESEAVSRDEPPPEDNLGNVCVFCSASLEDPAYLKDGYELGRQLALNRMGCVSGAGTIGVMGAVARGSVEAGGWTAGSNVPHIIELEGLPDGLASFWLRPDIYTRMEAMIENSQAFVIFPGGSGTVQELLALLIFKESGHALMRDKPIIVFNRALGDGSGGRFWDKLIAMLEPCSQRRLFEVVDELNEVVPAARQALERRSPVTAKGGE